MSGSATARDVGERVFAVLEPLARERGLELVHVETSASGHRPLLRVFLDRPDGIDLDAICEANAWISDALEVDDPFGSSYVLEVSSPGIDRPLRGAADFERFAGEDAVVKTSVPVGDRRSHTGRLEGVEGDVLLMTVEGREVRLPLCDIRKARLKGALGLDDDRNGV